MTPPGISAARFFHLDGWNDWRFVGDAVPSEVRFDRSGLHLPPSGRLPGPGRSALHGDPELPMASLAPSGPARRAEARGLAFDHAGMPTAVQGDGRGFCLVGGRAEAPPVCWGLLPGRRLGGLAIDARGRLYAALPDDGEVRVLRLSPPGEVARIEGVAPVGVACDGRGRLFVLDRADGPARAPEGLGTEIELVRGTSGDAIAASREGLIAVVTAGATHLLLGPASGSLARVELGRPALPAIAFDPARPASEKEAFLFVGDRISGRVVRWHVVNGRAEPTAWSEAIDGWTALASAGGALFGLGATCAVRPIAMEPEGFYVRQGRVVLGPLDAGVPGTEWHRITAVLDPPPSPEAGVRVEVLAEDARDAYDPAVPGDDPRWTEPRELIAPRAGRPAELGLLGARGRYAWVRLTLHGDGRHTPRVKWVRVEHPRDSYLRYLPAIYSEDPEGRDLTARFLSLFEAMEVDLGAGIDALRRLFDPLSGDPELVPWLAERLDLVLDPAWSVPRRREILAATIALYRRRGTRAALETMLRWYGGDGIRVVEGWQTRASFALDGSALVGCATVLPGVDLPPRVELGRGRPLGASRVDASPGAEVELQLAGRGEILVLLPAATTEPLERIARLRRIAEREAPAGAVVRLITAASGPRLAIGRAGRLDVDAMLGRPAPFHLAGEEAPGAPGPRSVAREPFADADLALGIGPRLGMDSKL
ncbi:phage tail protein [Sorangium sp. So ce117]|uniref:phage tail protein n=1 Tax=Sorangium sp. So ce117 TaxID=3133277 RepID=UPI003F631CD6